MKVPSMPFRILAVGPFRSQGDVAWSEGPVRIDKKDLDQAIDSLDVALDVPMPDALCPAGSLHVECRCMKDFSPDGIIRNTAYLGNILDARKFIEEAMRDGTSPSDIGARLAAWPDLPPLRIRVEPRKPKKKPSSAVEDILSKVALPGEAAGHARETGPLAAQLDALLRGIMEHLFSNEAFRRLEAAWRGLEILARQGGIDGAVALEIVPLSLDTLDASLAGLMKGLIQDPPSVILVDLPFDTSPRSLELLARIAERSETLLVPSVCWITPEFFNIHTWKELADLPYLPHHLEDAAFAKWRRLKASSAARWLTVTCNRFLTRYPFGAANKPRLVRFEEPRPLWISPVWAVGCLLGQSFAATGWPTRLTDWRDIKLQDLALDEGDPGKPLPTEAALEEDRIHQFIRAGITPLAAAQGRDIAFLPFETTVEGVSLGYQAALSRITHFILWCKDHFEADIEPSSLRERLAEAFSLFFESGGHEGPEHLEIIAGKPGADGRIPLRIILNPSRKVLPSGERIELAFSW